MSDEQRPAGQSLSGQSLSGQMITGQSEVHQDLARQIERMHRRFLDVMRQELGRIGVNDLSPVQVLMLTNIGPEEMAVRDLIERGYYLGSNASYNLKQLVEGGYVERKTDPRDKRSARLRLSDKGRKLALDIAKMEKDLASSILRSDADRADFETTAKVLKKLERRWSDTLRFEATDDL